MFVIYVLTPSIQPPQKLEAPGAENSAPRESLRDVPPFLFSDGKRGSLSQCSWVEMCFLHGFMCFLHGFCYVFFYMGFTWFYMGFLAVEDGLEWNVIDFTLQWGLVS